MNQFSDDEGNPAPLGTSSDMPLFTQKKEDAQPVKEEEIPQLKKRRRPIFDENYLLRPTEGLPQLTASMQATMKWKGRGHEAEDVENMMSKYRGWATGLTPWLAFEDFVARCNTLKSKPGVQSTLEAMRQDERDRYLERKFPHSATKNKQPRVDGDDNDDDGVVYDEVGSSSSTPASSSAALPPQGDPEALKRFLAQKRAEALAKLALKKKVAEEEARLKEEGGGGVDDDDDDDDELDVMAAAEMGDIDDDELENELLDGEYATAAAAAVSQSAPEGAGTAQENDDGNNETEETEAQTERQALPLSATFDSADNETEAQTERQAPQLSATFDNADNETEAQNGPSQTAVVEAGAAAASFPLSPGFDEEFEDLMNDGPASSPCGSASASPMRLAFSPASLPLAPVVAHEEKGSGGGEGDTLEPETEAQRH